MSSSTEPTASTAPHDTAAPKTSKKKKKSEKSEKSTKRTNKKSSSSSSSPKGRSSPAAPTEIQQALARQQQTIREGTALLAARFRAGLYFWPLDTSLGRVPSGGDRFFVQDAVVPLGYVCGGGGGGGGAKMTLPGGAGRGGDHGGEDGASSSASASVSGDGEGDGDVDRAGAPAAGEAEAGLETDRDHRQDYVARAQAEAVELARRFQEVLADEVGGCCLEGEEEDESDEERKEDGDVDMPQQQQQRRRRQQQQQQQQQQHQQWRRPGGDKGHRGRLPRLANEARTVVVYRLEDVDGQRQPARGEHRVCTW